MTELTLFASTFFVVFLLGVQQRLNSPDLRGLFAQVRWNDGFGPRLPRKEKSNGL